MTSYHYQTSGSTDIEMGGKTMTRAEERMTAYKNHANDEINTLKKRPSFSERGHKLVRKTSSRLGLVRKGSIGFHNEGTLCEHIVTCKMDCFDCCVVGVCYLVIGMLVLGIFLAFVVGGEARNIGYGRCPTNFFFNISSFLILELHFLYN
jgi:hypothetical protein